MSEDPRWLDGNALERFFACPVCDQIARVAAALPDRHAVHLIEAWRLEMPRA
jgi:hypothetical protein